ncbi:MAG: type II toxin-antitoxin system RelE/ParE family toxin [Patescibacteria group bacterium]|nr:type II toxin-antitoxin system RelE/ParE family toxin [Patescibacteria group bacterium]
MEISYCNQKTARFYSDLEPGIQKHVDKAFELLKGRPYDLGLPLSRSLGDGLFELRVIDLIHVRFIYTFHNNVIWMLHGFIKKTRRISFKDMDYARKELRKLLY